MNEQVPSKDKLDAIIDKLCRCTTLVYQGNDCRSLNRALDKICDGVGIVVKELRAMRASHEPAASKDVTTCGTHAAEHRLRDTLPCPWCVIDELKRERAYWLGLAGGASDEPSMDVGDRLVYRKTYDGGRYKRGEYLATLVRKYASGQRLILIDGERLPTETSETKLRSATVADIERLGQSPTHEPGVIQLEGECPSCRQWVVLRTDTDEAHVLPAIRCACGAHEWPPNSVQIEDSRGRLHTLRGCQPGATSTKDVKP